MALVVADRVQETTSTTSTSDYVLLGAAAGYQSFGAVLSNADTTYYAITNDTDWEVGIGTYSTTGPTLARTTILASSNAGSAVIWGAGVKNIFISYAASKSVYLDASGNLSVADKIIHTGDTDTAIRFPAADTVSIETNGTERFKVENSTITSTVPIVLPANPTTSLQAATKSYVDTIASASIHYHAPVRVESPTALTVTYNNGTSGVGATLTNAGTQAVLVLDGITLSVNDRVLIYTQADQTQNGVYTVTNVGSVSTNWVMTRSTDTNTYAPSSPTALGAGDAFFVSQGNTGAGELYVCNTPGTITFGTTNITFVQISATAVYTAGTGISLTNNVITNTAPDQVVALTQGGATTITGTYPNFTISSTNTVYTADGGIDLTGTSFSVAAGTGLTQDSGGLSHADTSSQASVDNTGATFVQDINLDGFGHVTGAASVTVTPSLIGAPQNDGTGATGTWGISISGNAANVTGTVAIANGGTGAMTAPQALTNLAAAPLASPALTGNVTVSDNSANPAVKITQTGAGAALLVEDSTSPDASPFIIDASGNVGIGTSSPSTLLAVDGGLYTQTQYSGVPSISLRRAFGTKTSPLAIQSLNTVGRIQGQGYDGTNYRSVAQIDATTDGAVSPTSAPGFLAFFTTASGTVSVTERMRIDSAGNVGIGTTSPVSRLTVGSISVAENGSTSYGSSLVRGVNYSLSDTQRGILDIEMSAVSAIDNGATLTFTNNSSQFIQGYDYVGVGIKAGKETSANLNESTYLAISTNNNISLAERMRIDSSGNVGIGTTSPATKLHVAGDTTLGGALIETVYAISGTTPALDPSNGTIQTWTLTGASTPTSSLNAGEAVTLMIDDGTAYTITWTSVAVTWKTDGGSAPTLNTTGYTAIVLWKVGSVVYGARVGNA